MRLVAKGWCFGPFAHAKPHFFRFIEQDLHAPERQALYFFMGAVAKGSFFTETAAAPGIDLSGFRSKAHGFTGGHFGEAFIGYCVHDLYLLAMNL
jgi:hypothetical protein